MIYFRSVLCFLFLPRSSFGVDDERRSVVSRRSCPCPVGTSNIDCASQACPSEYSACGLDLLEEYKQEGDINWAGISNTYIAYKSRSLSKTWTSSVVSGPSTYYYPSHKSPVVIDGKNQYKFHKYRVRLVHDITGVQLTFDANICVKPKITYIDKESMLSLFETFPHDYAIALKIISVNGHGIQFFHYSYVGGAYGGKNYIDTSTASIPVLMHEVGHTLEQHRRLTHGDGGVLNPAWRRAIECDDVRTSGYGNNNEWEDLAEFARLFALAATKNSLADQSPERFFVWDGTVAIAQDAYPPEISAPSAAPSASSSPTEDASLSVAPSPSPSITCVNNRTYKVSEASNKGCAWVMLKPEERRQKLCRNNSTLSNCPISCGLCCADDETFRFKHKKDSDTKKTCSWLRNKNKKTIRKYCKKKKVKTGCAKTCIGCVD